MSTCKSVHPTALLPSATKINLQQFPTSFLESSRAKLIALGACQHRPLQSGQQGLGFRFLLRVDWHIATVVKVESGGYAIVCTDQEKL